MTTGGGGLRTLIGVLTGLVLACSCGASEAPSLINEAQPIEHSAFTETRPLLEALGLETEDTGLVPSIASVEVRIAECMRAAGFEYIPAPSAARDPMSDIVDGLRFGTYEFALAFGYGQTTQLVDRLDSIRADLTDSAGNPNVEIVGALSPGAAELYWQALRGPSLELDVESGLPIDPASGEPTDDFAKLDRGAGCRNRAVTETYSRGGFDVDAIQQLVSEADIAARVAADFSVIGALEDRSRCMSEAGLERFAQFGQAIRFFQERSAELERQVLTPDVVAQLQDGSLDNYELAPHEVEAIEQAADEEVRVAVKDFECSQGYFAARSEATVRFEQAWVSENEVRILEFIAANRAQE